MPAGVLSPPQASCDAEAMAWGRLSCSLWNPHGLSGFQAWPSAAPGFVGCAEVGSVSVESVIMPCCPAVIPALLEKSQALVSSEREFLQAPFPLAAPLRALGRALVALSAQAWSGVLTSLPAKAPSYQN